MKKRLFFAAVIGFMVLGVVGSPVIFAGNAVQTQSSMTVSSEMVLTGRVDETVVVSTGGVLTLLGMVTQDVIVEQGGVAYVYGVVNENVLNRGGQLEVYGVVGGYVYTDSGGDTFIDPNALVVGTPPLATPTPFPTPVPVTPTATPLVVETPTPAPTATPTPAPAAGVIDLSMSIYRSLPTDGDRMPYEEIVRYFADGVYEMSNGAHQIGTVTIYQNGRRDEHADVIWVAEEWPCAIVGGVTIPGAHIRMGDVFPFSSPYDAMDSAHWRCVGYVLAHEWGHYYYAVYDEYQGDHRSPRASSPQPDDVPVENSVMNDTWIACEEGDFDWLNFSIPRNQTGRNAQYRAYEASAWETLVRPPSQDPRNGNRVASIERPYYPELADFAPPGNEDASLELTAPDAESRARSALNIVWADQQNASNRPVNGLMASTPPELSYDAVVQLLSGEVVQYPQPVILVAKVTANAPIAKADVRAGVMLPDGTIHALDLRDDGLAPDPLADDGLYSGYMPYRQEGEHLVFASFNNLAGIAEETEISLDHNPGPDGDTAQSTPQPISENFYAVADAIISVEDIRHDDHGNVAADATSLTLNNVDVTGRIDYSGDVDMFEVIPSANGRFVLRLSNFAFDMQPNIQVLDADGVTLVEEYEFVPEDDQYFFTPLRGRAGDAIYLAVTHLDANAEGGLYDVSIGAALPNDTESPPFNLLLVLIPLAALLLLSGLYVLFRPRPAPRAVSMPKKRQAAPPVPRRQQRKAVEGSSIYKNAAEEPVSEQEERVE